MCRQLAMHLRVTCGTERNQVLLGIVSGLASKLLVVDFKVQPSAAYLVVVNESATRSGSGSLPARPNAVTEF
jgi:hypothetical protein